MQPNVLEEAIPRWNLELGLAAAFLAEDPLTAAAWTRRIEREIATELERAPANEQLAQLRSEAHILYEESCESSQRFLEESQRRRVAFETRERATFARPLRSLRRPFEEH